MSAVGYKRLLVDSGTLGRAEGCGGGLVFCHYPSRTQNELGLDHRLADGLYAQGAEHCAAQFHRGLSHPHKLKKSALLEAELPRAAVPSLACFSFGCWTTPHVLGATCGAA